MSLQSLYGLGNNPLSVAPVSSNPIKPVPVPVAPVTQPKGTGLVNIFNSVSSIFNSGATLVTSVKGNGSSLPTYDPSLPSSTYETQSSVSQPSAKSNTTTYILT